jgi:hypothetical protein
MSAVLAPRTAELLIRVCGMLGSDHAGEAANAARQATRIIQEHGQTWEGLLRPIIAAAPSRRGPSSDWRVDATICLARADLLTAWERGFVANLMRLRRRSPKQEAILARLVERVRVAAGGAP